jgi:hypothetical protein
LTPVGGGAAQHDYRDPPASWPTTRAFRSHAIPLTVLPFKEAADLANRRPDETQIAFAATIINS